MASPYLRYKTFADKTWPYEEYYVGEKDERDRKGGAGEHHWFGAKSIEWYTGNLVRDTMHGLGDYRWRFAGYDGVHTTYEGHFFSNDMHGYGTMSYPDGVVFTGLYSNNIRYGPGVDTNFTHADVGLWRGMRLVRLAWRPGCSLVPDLTRGELARLYVEPHRALLASNSVTIRETNSALDLLKQNGCDPQRAVEKWTKLYPRHCTDQASQLCDVKLFQEEYYRGVIRELVVIDALPQPEEIESIPDPTSEPDAILYYYAWNNSELMIDMMKHSYKHEDQRMCQEMSMVDLLCIMSGHRKAFKNPGKYEVDSRTLLMASFLGDVEAATQLINDSDVCPGVTDSKGNSALMYAAFGDQTDIIHFLVEAGANVDCYNDSCCTPLGMTILRYLFTVKDVTPSEMIQALTPPPVLPLPPSSDVVIEVDEWNIARDAIFQQTAGLNKSPSKFLKNSKKSAQSLKDAPKKKQDAMLSNIPEAVSAESITDDNQTYNRINIQYVSAINDIFVLPSITNAVTYIFEINDMTLGINDEEETPKKADKAGPKKAVSKVLKQTTKPSKEAMYRSSEKDISSIDETVKLKNDTLSKIMYTILQLLSDGANPTLVKNPQPALLMAVLAGSPDLVQHLGLHGADVNEIYPNTFGYTPLDIAMSQPMTPDNLDLIRTLLECGSKTNHRLKCFNQDEEIPGPTLLHVLLAKKTESDAEIEMQQDILDLLLQYKCDPSAQFKGRSAIDIAMSKGAYLLDIFIENPNTNLNAVINHYNQTILVKTFSPAFYKTVNPTERLQTITNLLLFGADPLIECQNDQEMYKNIFVFVKKKIIELENVSTKPAAAASSGKPDTKAKGKKEKEPAPAQVDKPAPKAYSEDIMDYKQAQELMTDCARMLYIRWLQAKLMRELVCIIDKFQHRQWNMILREHKNKKCVGLWLTPERCLEVWDIFKTTKQKIYKNNRILKHLLCIVMFYNKKFKENLREPKMTAPTKNGIESEVSVILRDYAAGNKLTEEVPIKRPYVKPELTSRADKFNVCFECILPNEEDTIRCKSCKLIVFCSMECLKMNVDRPYCHPCSDYLRNVYFPSSSSSFDEPINTTT